MIKELLESFRQRCCRHNNLAADKQVPMVFCPDCGWVKFYTEGQDFEGFRKRNGFSKRRKVSTTEGIIDKLSTLDNYAE